MMPGPLRDFYVTLLDGSGNVISGTAPLQLVGNLTNNNAAPAGTNVGALTGIANAAAPLWSEGNLVLASYDLAGNHRVTGVLSNNAAVPGATNVGALTGVANAASPTITEGRQALISLDLTGRQRMRGTLTNNNAAPSGDNLGVLPALANAAAPSWSEGFEVLLSTTLAGLLRTSLGDLISGEDQGNNILRVGGKGGGWAINHNPGTGTQATKSQASGGGTVRNVCTALSFGYTSNTTAPTNTILTVNLRDGASGAGTVLWSWSFDAPNTLGATQMISLGGLWIEGSQATAMTLEFTAGLANCLQFVNLAGCTIAS